MSDVDNMEKIGKIIMIIVFALVIVSFLVGAFILAGLVYEQSKLNDELDGAETYLECYYACIVFVQEHPLIKLDNLKKQCVEGCQWIKEIPQ